jgi:uncharacterized membrane protein YbaN (DUF454 family)
MAAYCVQRWYRCVTFDFWQLVPLHHMISLQYERTLWRFHASLHSKLTFSSMSRQWLEAGAHLSMHQRLLLDQGATVPLSAYQNYPIWTNSATLLLVSMKSPAHLQTGFPECPLDLLNVL